MLVGCNVGCTGDRYGTEYTARKSTGKLDQSIHDRQRESDGLERGHGGYTR